MHPHGKAQANVQTKGQSKMVSSVGSSGATGQTSAATANALVGQPTVRVAVRNESKGAIWKAQRAHVAIVEGFADVDALGRAFKGVSGAYVLNPHDYASDD
jgi:uncharacterized protein YbjT (DUF2867 family)